MLSPRLLKIYLAKRFVWKILIVSFWALVILSITNSFDVLQRFRSSPLALSQLWQLIILKLPFLYTELSALLGFFATILFFQELAKSNELLVIVNSGLPLTRVIAVPAVLSLIYGIIVVALIYPVGVIGLNKVTRLEKSISKNSKQETEVFLIDQTATQKLFIQADNIDITQQQLLKATILVLQEDALVQRIDAPIVKLQDGYLQAAEAIVHNKNQTKQIQPFKLPTNLAIHRLAYVAQPANHLQLWQLSELAYQKRLSKSANLKHRLFYNKLLFKPFIILAMSLIGSCMVNFGQRHHNKWRTALIWLTGIITLSILQLVFRILAYSGFIVELSILLPVLFIMALSNFVILHLQEG